MGTAWEGVVSAAQPGPCLSSSLGSQASGASWAKGTMDEDGQGPPAFRGSPGWVPGFGPSQLPAGDEVLSTLTSVRVLKVQRCCTQVQDAAWGCSYQGLDKWSLHFQRGRLSKPFLGTGLAIGLGGRAVVHGTLVCLVALGTPPPRPLGQTRGISLQECPGLDRNLLIYPPPTPPLLLRPITHTLCSQNSASTRAFAILFFKIFFGGSLVAQLVEC